MSDNAPLLEERVFAEVKRLCYVGLDETTLLREAAERLRRVVPFEAYCAFVTDPMSRLIVRSLAEEMGGERGTYLLRARLLRRRVHRLRLGSER